MVDIFARRWGVAMTLYTPSGQAIEPRAERPTRNVHLQDGRILRYRGGYAAIPNSGVWDGGDGMRVIASSDENQHGTLLHVSLSYPDRNPSWEDIKQVRGAFYAEDIDCMMVLPKTADYVNLHPHTFHIWQTPVEWGVL